MKAIYEAPSIEVLTLETESAMLARQSLYPTKQTDPADASKAYLTVDDWDASIGTIDITLEADPIVK